jgi:hypothetical protein
MPPIASRLFRGHYKRCVGENTRKSANFPTEIGACPHDNGKAGRVECVGLPIIKTPLIECQTAIPLSNILDGATVILYRNGSQTATQIFDRSSLTWIGIAPLLEGETIEIAQAVFCREGGTRPTGISEKARAIVQSTDALPAPHILNNPLCPQSPFISLTNLVPGARLLLFEDGQPLGMTDVPATVFDFYVPSLVAGSSITARLQLCGKDGPLSDAVLVEGETVIAELEPSTLYACSSYIYASFSNTSSQSSVAIVYAQNGEGWMISDYHHVYSGLENYNHVLLPVSPALIQDDKITLVVIGCNGEQRSFGPFVVQPFPGLEPPQIGSPIEEGRTWVSVVSPIAGAMLRVYVDGVFAGQAISYGDKFIDAPGTRIVYLNHPLLLGQVVTATQTFCNETSSPSTPQIVVIPKPQMPILLEPHNEQSGVNVVGAAFEWQDPGSKTSAAATSFKLRLTKEGGILVHEGSTNTTTYTLNFNLDYNTPYRWSVEAANSTGVTSSHSFLFFTQDAPPEQPPTQALLTFVSDLFATSDCATILYPVPANQPFKLFIDAYSTQFSGTNRLFHPECRPSADAGFGRGAGVSGGEHGRSPQPLHRCKNGRLPPPNWRKA